LVATFDLESAAAAPASVDEFQAFADTLKLLLPSPANVAPAEIARDLELIDAVRQNYVGNRPGPESFPAMALQVITLLGRADADIPRLSQMISRDPGLTAAILRVVNSAAYRGLSKTLTVRDAIARLGLVESARIAGAAAAKSLFDSRGRSATLPFAADFEALYINAVTCAVTSSWVAMQRPPIRADRCYLGGLLHDIGRSLALRSVASMRAQGLSELVPRSPRTHRVVDNLHVSIGVDALKAWQLPDFAVDIAAKHHISALAPGDGDPELQVVALVSALQLLRTAPAQNPGSADDLVMSAKALGITPPMLRTIDAERARFEALARSLATS
jgi:HD-like signal output (HDOD) protein